MLINDFEFVVDKVMKVANQIVVIGKVTRGCVLKDVDTTVYRKNKLHKVFHINSIDKFQAENVDYVQENENAALFLDGASRFDLKKGDILLKGQQSKCIKCGSEISSDTVFCPICGKKQETEERKCIDCGTVLSKEVLFCPKCGTKQNDSYAIKLEVYNILKDAVEKLAKTKIVKVVSYLNVTKKQLAEFMDTCYNTEIYGQTKFSEEDFVFAISKNDHHLLFMTYGIKDYLSEARYELEYKDIGDINSYSYRNSIYLEQIELPCFNLHSNSVRFGLDFQDYDDWNLKYKWVEILQKLIDLGKAQQPDEDNSEDEFYDDNNDDNYIYEDSNNDNYEPEDYYDDYGSGDYNDNDSYEDSSYVDITQKKEKIYQTVLNYASKIGEDCVGWKLWKYNNYPTEKKDLLLKFDSNFNYDDFACLFAIPNALKFQLSPKGDYGILFTLSGFYIKDPLMQTYFIKYSEITKCDIIKKRDIRIHLNHKVTALISDETFVDNCEYSALPLANLLKELKSIDSDYPSDHLIATRSDRTVGIHSAHDRKIFLEGQKNGYIRCSREYEIKLRRQAELFLKTTNKWRRERDEYEALLDEYDATINELEAKLAETESPEYRQRLNNVSNYRDQLKALSY